MINGSLDQFLDTGWFSDATIFLNGQIYWCEAEYDSTMKKIHFFVNKWKASNENNMFFHTFLNQDGTLDWSSIYEDFDIDVDLIKKRFLQAKIFDEKSFWEVESEIAWLDDAGPVYEQDVSE